jgi:hypothetical protein
MDNLKVESNSRSEKGDSIKHVTSSQDKKQLVVFICETFKVFSSKDNLRTHVHENKRLFKCEICSYNCFRKCDIKAHVALVHDQKKPFKC